MLRHYTTKHIIGSLKKTHIRAIDNPEKAPQFLRAGTLIAPFHVSVKSCVFILYLIHRYCYFKFRYLIICTLVETLGGGDTRVQIYPHRTFTIHQKTITNTIL